MDPRLHGGDKEDQCGITVAEGFMRLDLFLKTSRLVKRRSVAKDYCDAGKVRVGGSAAKAGRELKAGDVLTLNLPKRRVTVEVVEIPLGNVTKERAQTLYRILEDVVKGEGL